jgi:hypothetical protein
MTTPTEPVPGSFWRDIVSRVTLEDFARAFLPDVRFETSSCNRTVRGPADMRTLIRAMSSLYTSLAFTSEHSIANRTYLEWTGNAFGGDIAGVTVVVWDTSVRIAAVFLHQRPLDAVARFAAELARHDLPGFSGGDFTPNAEASQMTPVFRERDR